MFPTTTWGNGEEVDAVDEAALVVDSEVVLALPPPPMAEATVLVTVFVAPDGGAAG